MSWLSAAWQRNSSAITSIAGKALTGNFVGIATELAGDARAEARRVVARVGGSPDAQAAVGAQASNAVTAGVAAVVPASAQPTLLNPLGAAGSQRVALGNQTVSVNQMAAVGGALLLLVILLMVAKR
jgi:hypothetical protein